MHVLADLAPEGLFGWHPAVVWVAVGALLVLLEIAVPAFIIGPFGVAAFLAALAAFVGASTTLQIVLFAVGGVLLVVPARRYLARRSPRARGGGFAGVTPGRVGICIDHIEAGADGVVAVDGVRWTASTAAGPIAKGAAVEVVAVDDTRLIVRARATTNQGV